MAMQSRALRRIRRRREAHGTGRPAPIDRSTPSCERLHPEGWSAFENSGWRWTGLGVLLLGVMITGIWEAKHNAVAISAVLVAIPAILHEVPKIMDARTRAQALFQQQLDKTKR